MIFQASHPMSAEMELALLITVSPSPKNVLAGKEYKVDVQGMN